MITFNSICGNPIFEWTIKEGCYKHTVLVQWNEEKNCYCEVKKRKPMNEKIQITEEQAREILQKCYQCYTPEKDDKHINRKIYHLKRNRIIEEENKMDTQEIKNKIEELEKEIASLKKEVENSKDDFTYQANYFLDGDLEIREANNILYHFSKLENFNMFSSEEIAEKWKKKIQALLKLRMITEYLHGGEWEPDWEDDSQNKINIYREAGEINTVDSYVQQEFVVSFKTAELAEKAIEMMGEESLKDYFL